MCVLSWIIRPRATLGRFITLHRTSGQIVPILTSNQQLIDS